MLLIFLYRALAKGRGDRLDTECRTGSCKHYIQSSSLRIRIDNTGMDIDIGMDMDTGTDSNREIDIDIEGILGMSDIPDTMSCLLAVL